MPLLEQPLKILLGKPKPCDQLCKNVLEKWIQPDILSQPEKRVRINMIVAKTSDLELNSLEFIQSMTIALRMRLNKSHNLFWIKLVKFHNPIIPRTDLDTGSGVKLA